MQTGPFPKIPTLGVSGEVSKFDVRPIGRLLLSTLPPGDSHCRIVHSQSEFRLIQTEFLPQLPNWSRPLGARTLRFLGRFRHIPLLLSPMRPFQHSMPTSVV